MNQQLFTIFEKAINDAIEIGTTYVHKEKKGFFKGFFISKHDKYPEVSFSKNGLPIISILPKEISRIDYTKILSSHLKENTIDSWEIFFFTINNNEKLKRYWSVKKWIKDDESTMKYSVFNFLKEIVDHTINSVKNASGNSVKKRKILNRYFEYVSNGKLSYELKIPIVNCLFNFKSIKINNNISLKKISKIDQESRILYYKDRAFLNIDMSYHSSHEIVFGKFDVDISDISKWEINGKLEEIIKNKTNQIVEIFELLRISIGMPVGFRDVYLKPVAFSYSSVGAISKVEVFEIDNIPNDLKGKPNYDIVLLNKESLFFFKNSLKKDIPPQVNLSLRKLFHADLRKNKADYVIDIATAFESLLSESKDTIKYKISLRTAVLSKNIDQIKLDPVDVKSIMKKFYDLRSAIVHGTTKTRKKNESHELIGGVSISTVTMSKFILIEVIKFLISNPKFLDMNEFDNSLILNTPNNK